MNRSELKSVSKSIASVVPDIADKLIERKTREGLEDFSNIVIHLSGRYFGFYMRHFAVNNSHKKAVKFANVQTTKFAEEFLPDRDTSLVTPIVISTATRTISQIVKTWKHYYAPEMAIGAVGDYLIYYTQHFGTHGDAKEARTHATGCFYHDVYEAERFGEKLIDRERGC